MSWYRTGSISVTGGSAVINGAGTDFVANVAVGEALLGPDLRVYEVGAVVSATVLTLVGNYAGATAGAQPYAILPTQSSIRDLALAAAELLGTFGAVRDGIGQGLIADGSPATPGIRFAADQDTGLRRHVANGLALVAGGVDRLTVDTSGVTVAGDGNLVAGIQNPPFASHHVGKAGAEGTVQMVVGAASQPAISAAFYAVASGAYSGLGSAMAVGKHAQTGRSINTGGTVNASGADYAEYMTKVDGCGTIAPGDVCGVDRDGRLTRTWTDAVSFVVKSTDPAYVGGDSWARHLPDQPKIGDSEDEAAFARRLRSWEALLEAERVKVDRIAFCGQVPVNVTGDFAVGDYLIAAATGAGIKAVAVPEADITFDQYRRRLGKVWAVRDGRAWIDVQHG